MTLRDIDITAPGKLLALLLIILICGLYVVFGEGDKSPAWGILGSCLGYLVGNGVGAKRGVPQAPTFAPKQHEEATA